MSRAIDRVKARRAEVLGDGPSAGDFVPWLSMLSSATGAAGKKPDAAASQQAAVQAALAKKQAEEQATTTKMFAIGGGVLGLAAVLYVALKK